MTKNFPTQNVPGMLQLPASADVLSCAEVDDAKSLLNAIDQGDSRAPEKLLEIVYEELRRIAAFKLAQQAPGQTLQPTALVHEAWLKLVGAKNSSFNDHRHFFSAAAEAMRH